MTIKTRKRKNQNKSALTVTALLLSVVLVLLVWVAITFPKPEQEPKGGWQEINGALYYEDTRAILFPAGRRSTGIHIISILPTAAPWPPVG